MANPTTNFGWVMPTSTDLVTDLPADFATFGQAVDTSMAELKGGTTGQVLSKTSNTDMDFTWVAQDDSNAIQNAIVDAKGDLIAASAADTPARLAVGNNGETLVADSATSTGLRYQSAYNGNAIINGGFDIWQRGTSVAASTTAFLADRWRAYRNAAGATFSRQTSSLTGIQYCQRVQRDSGNAFTNGISSWYTSESADAYRFAGQTVTLSFYARAGANFSAASSALSLVLATGTGQDQAYPSFTGYANAINTTQVITTSWVRYSFNATLGSSVSQFAIDFSYAPVGTAGTNDYYEITGVQLEVGSVATTFKRAGGGTIQGELAAASRYYTRFNANGGGNFSFLGTNGYQDTTTSANGFFALPVEMRVYPSSVDYSANLYIFNMNATNYTVSAVTLNNGGNTKLAVASFAVTGATAGQPAMPRANNSTTSYVGFSAEL
jgi:hypothetical protein